MKPSSVGEPFHPVARSGLEGLRRRANDDMDAIAIRYRNSTTDEKRQIRAAIDPDDLWSDNQVARLNALLLP